MIYDNFFKSIFDVAVAASKLYLLLDTDIDDEKEFTIKTDTELINVTKDMIIITDHRSKRVKVVPKQLKMITLLPREKWITILNAISDGLGDIIHEFLGENDQLLAKLPDLSVAVDNCRTGIKIDDPYVKFFLINNDYKLEFDAGLLTAAEDLPDIEDLVKERLKRLKPPKSLLLKMIEASPKMVAELEKRIRIVNELIVFLEMVGIPLDRWEAE